jgi:hypothetical protein
VAVRVAQRLEPRRRKTQAAARVAERRIPAALRRDPAAVAVAVVAMQLSPRARAAAAVRAAVAVAVAVARQALLPLPVALAVVTSRQARTERDLAAPLEPPAQGPAELVALERPQRSSAAARAAAVAVADSEPPADPVALVARAAAAVAALALAVRVRSVELVAKPRCSLGRTHEGERMADLAGLQAAAAAAIDATVALDQALADFNVADADVNTSVATEEAAYQAGLLAYVNARELARNAHPDWNTAKAALDAASAAADSTALALRDFAATYG